MQHKILVYGFYLLTAAGILFSSCQREDINTFDSTNSLYFAETRTLSYSFFYTESTLTEDTLYVSVRLTGKLLAEGRPISFVQLNADEEGAAIAGTHYVAFDDPRLSTMHIMPANQTAVSVPIIIKKTADMEAGEFTLKFGLLANEHFVSGLKEYTSYTITMTAMPVKPPGWGYYYELVFGTWGPEKMKFIIDHVGFSDFEIVLDNNYDLRRYLSMKSRELLEEYVAEHGELLEADGSVVSFDV